MPNYKLIIQYDGTDYSGWQIQKNAPSVQQSVIDAIKQITGEEVNLIGSGRTDAGVHAIGQAAHFKIDKELSTYRISHALNAILPESISIKEMTETSDTFHSRFDAVERSYIYFISGIKSPFYNKYSHQDTRIYNLDLNKLNDLSRNILGKKDFTSFARKNTETENKVCEVCTAHWRKTGNFLLFYISADRFLHGMVRTIVGTLTGLVEKRSGKKELTEILDLKDREAAGEAAPAKGLFLYKVRYK